LLDTIIFQLVIFISTYNFISDCEYVKGKGHPATGRGGPRGFRVG